MEVGGRSADLRHAVFQAGKGDPFGRVGVDHATDVRPGLVDRPVNDEAGRSHGTLVRQLVPVDVDLRETGCRDLVVQQPVTVGQERVVLIGHARRDVVPDKHRPAEMFGKLERGGKIDSLVPFRLRAPPPRPNPIMAQ